MVIIFYSSGREVQITLITCITSTLIVILGPDIFPLIIGSERLQKVSKSFLKSQVICIQVTIDINLVEIFLY